MKAFRNIFPGLSAMLMAAAFVCSCSSDDDAVVIPTTPSELESAPIHFITQLGAKGGSANQAKAVTLSFDDGDNKGKGPQRVIARPDENDKTLNTSWAVGEKVALVYNYYFPRIVEATVTSVINGNATIEGVLPVRPADNTAVKIVYPYDAVEEYTPTTEETAGEIKPDYLKTGQDGTIATISQKYDVAVGYGNLSVAAGSNEASLKQKVDLQNQYAILRMKFTDSEGADITGITTLTLTNTSVSPEADLVTVRGTDPDGYIYIAMEPVSTTTTISFSAANYDYIYNGTASLSLLEASKYYRSTLGLPSKEENKWVDLGLSVMWAKWNVGASKPEEYGDWFAWGETEPYYTEGNAPTAETTQTDDIWKTSLKDPSKGYSWENYFDLSPEWVPGLNSGGNPYQYEFLTYRWNLSTTPDVRKLKPEHDAATVNWGSPWRMPTLDELLELLVSYPDYEVYSQENFAYVDEEGWKGFCNWIEDYNNTGVKGLAFYKGSDPSKIVLFLPAAGTIRQYTNSRIGIWGEYWTSETYDRNMDYGHTFFFNSRWSGRDQEDVPRYNGLSVRPVYAP